MYSLILFQQGQPSSSAIAVGCCRRRFTPCFFLSSSSASYIPSDSAKALVDDSKVLFQLRPELSQSRVRTCILDSSPLFAIPITMSRAVEFSTTLHNRLRIFLPNGHLTSIATHGQHPWRHEEEKISKPTGRLLSPLHTLLREPACIQYLHTAALSLPVPPSPSALSIVAATTQNRASSVADSSFRGAPDAAIWSVLAVRRPPSQKCTSIYCNAIWMIIGQGMLPK